MGFGIRHLGDLAKRRDFVLVGVQLPIIKPAVDFLDRVGRRPWLKRYAGMWREFESEATRRRFADMGIVFFDMARDRVTADSRNFIDPAHPSEAGTLGALVHLADDPRFRATFPALDVGGIAGDYERAKSSQTFIDIYH